MDLRQLAYFVRVIELRSFTRAANLLRISQPAIGERIRNLEAELNARLLVRHSRGVEPTEAGRLLFHRAQAILLQVDEAKTAIREFEEGLRGAVTLGLTPGLGEALAAKMIERCSRDYPGVTVNVIEDLSTTLIRRVSSGEAISFAVVSGFELAAAANIGSRKLYQEDLFAVASPKLLGKTDEPIAFHDLARFRLILLGDGSTPAFGLKALLIGIARDETVRLSIAYEIQAISVVKQLIGREIGVAILPFDTVRTQVEEGHLSARRIGAPAVTRELNLIWNATRAPSAAEEAVKGVLTALTADHRGDTAEAAARDKS